MKEEKSAKKVSKWIVFVSMPFQIGASIYLCYLLGEWMDVRFDVAGAWWTKGMTLMGLLASLVQIIRQVNRISKDE